MSKYCYGKISGSSKWYVRPKEWKQSTDNHGDLLKFCRVLMTFDRATDCIQYIDWLTRDEKKEDDKHGKRKKDRT